MNEFLDNFKKIIREHPKTVIIIIILFVFYPIYLIKKTYMVDTINVSYLLWGFQTSGHIVCKAYTDENAVYFNSYDGNAYALDKKDGSLIWKFGMYQSLGVIGGHMVDNTFLLHDDYVYTADLWMTDLIKISDFYCLDKATGRQIWRIRNYGTAGEPLVHANRVYFTDYRGTLYCIDNISGSILWKRPKAGIKMTRLKKGSVAYAYTWPGLLAISLNEPSIIWSCKVDRITNPVYYDNTIIYQGRDKFLYAVDAKTGQAKKKIEIDASISGRITNKKNIIIFNTYHTIYCYDAFTNKIIWQREGYSFFTSNPIIYNDYVIYFGISPPYSRGNGIILFDLKTGKEFAVVGVPDTSDSTPIIDNGVYYIGSTRGYFYALDIDKLIEDTKGAVRGK